MKAYKNDRGYILAVFKNDDGLYQIYRRPDIYSDFSMINKRIMPKKTREEAERDLDRYIGYMGRSTYKLIDFKGDM